MAGAQQEAPELDVWQPSCLICCTELTRLPGRHVEQPLVAAWWCSTCRAWRTPMLRDVAQAPAATFRCPQCSAVSCNPHDVDAGYCGACHDWTGEGA